MTQSTTTTKPMNPVVHFEMPAKDKKRVAKFYSTVFNWQMNVLGDEMNHYVLANTTETSEAGRPTQPGAINGGFFQYKDEDGFKYPSVVIAVDDLKKAMAAVKKAGGQVVAKPMDIPGIGTFTTIIDTEDNRVGMLQPLPMT